MFGGGSCVVGIGAEMRWHVTGGRVMSGIKICPGTRPVTRGRLEETTGYRDRYRCRRWWHQIELRVSVTRHKELALILVRRWICRCRLRGCCQTLKVKLVRVSLAVYLCHYVLVVIVSANQIGASNEDRGIARAPRKEGPAARACNSIGQTDGKIIAA